MKKLGDALETLSRSFENDDVARIALRAARVKTMFKEVIEKEYKQYAPIVLSHVNAVYIKDEGDDRQLIVYMDDSVYRSDLHTRQVIIMHHFSELFDEHLTSFKALASRFDMKKRHPYFEETDEHEGDGSKNDALSTSSVPLDESEKELVEERISGVENPRVRQALKDAMISDLEWQKSFRDKNGVFK